MKMGKEDPRAIHANKREKMRRTMRLGSAAFSIILIFCICGVCQENTTSDAGTYLVNGTAVSAGGSAMSADDILHKVDGTDEVGRLAAFDGGKFTVYVKGEAKEIPHAEVVSIALGQPQRRPKLLYVGSDTDDLANADLGEALKKAGFDLTAATRLPASLEGYDAVVLESVSASSPEAAKMLRSFVGKGGGAVVVGTVPEALCSEGKQDYYHDHDVKINTWDTSTVADWLGGATMESAQISSPRVAASIANPFFACPDINVGEELYVFQGERDVSYFATGSLSAQARPVAKIRFENEGYEFTNIAAFAHPFGKGRTYYQIMSYEANHPKLEELLVAGTKWAAGVLPEVGG